MVDQSTIGLLSSEIVLIGIAAFVFVAGAFYPRTPQWWPLFVLIVFAVLLGLYGTFDRSLADRLMRDCSGITVSGPLVVDLFGLLLRQFALVLGLLLTLLFWRREGDNLTSERCGLLVLIIVGVMLTARANDLVLLFLGLELVSIPTYVLLFLGRRDRANAEAAAKYFFLSIFSSAILLYGFSFLYGLGGTTALAGSVSIHASLVGGSPSGAMLTLALVLVMAGLGFKIAAVPFHFYAPDVYQGTTNSNAALLAIVPKVAGFLALVRVYVSVVPADMVFSWQLPLIVAVFTMTLGNVCALWQHNLRRLLAYSSIAHSGYLLIGVASSVADSSSNGIAAMIFYLFAYSLASFTTFAALTHLESPDRPLNQLDDLSGLGKSNPLVAAAMSVAMLSFAGIPILAGFWGKYGLFTSALHVAQSNDAAHVWFVALAVVAAINAAIGAAYYLRVISTMFFQDVRVTLPAQGGLGPFAAMLSAALLVLGIGLFPAVTMQRAQFADQSLPQGVSGSDSVATAHRSRHNIGTNAVSEMSP